jgi:hypothetical protein
LRKNTKHSSEPIETKTHKIILRSHIDENTQNNPQNPYRQQHTRQSSEPIEKKNTPSNPQNP